MVEISQAKKETGSRPENSGSRKKTTSGERFCVDPHFALPVRRFRRAPRDEKIAQKIKWPKLAEICTPQKRTTRPQSLKNTRVLWIGNYGFNWLEVFSLGWLEWAGAVETCYAFLKINSILNFILNSKLFQFKLHNKRSYTRHRGWINLELWVNKASKIVVQNTPTKWLRTQNRKDWKFEECRLQIGISAKTSMCQKTEWRKRKFESSQMFLFGVAGKKLQAGRDSCSEWAIRWADQIEPN